MAGMVALIDYGSGNLRSAEKALARAANESASGHEIMVTADPNVVAKAERSPAAVNKQTTGRTEDGLPVHSFRTLLADLATLTRNTLVTAIAPEQPFTLTARPTPLQQRAHDLLGLARTQ